MGLSLGTRVSELGRLGARVARPLKGMGIATVRDLLWHFPFRYDDLTRIVPLDGPTETPVTVLARVDMIRSRRSLRQHMLLTEATISDAAGSAKAIWFRQPFITKVLRPGDRVRFSGRIESKPWGLELVNPGYEKEHAGPAVHTGRLVPVYPLSGSLTAKQLRALLHEILPLAADLEETVDAGVRDSHGLLAVGDAVRFAHFPPAMPDAEAALRRFRFEELLVFMLKGAFAKRALLAKRAPVVPFDEAATRRFVASLPFVLTDDQKRVSWRILQDLESGTPSQRLVEGDVGSGKTVVAAMAMHACAGAGRGSLLMAPTEILAEQHFATVRTLFAATPFAVALRTRSHCLVARAGRIEELSKKAFLDAACVGEIPVVIGTHALLDDRLTMPHAALVVVDEQHRFGVSQRQELLERIGEDGAVPHFLSMTATPIPRTLALALYGDVEFSMLRQLPPGRMPVATRLASDRDRKALLDDVRSEAAEGRKTFVVCPLIETSEVLNAKAAAAEAERLRVELGGLEVGLLHGRMKTEEKQAVMERFAKGDLHVLVSTTVVEVGVDVPLATIMVIEGAERFGLAQLHQLRGRVGRSTHPSRCYLLLTEESSSARARLEAFVRARDCFELAELDLRFRGPGDLLGDSQSGFDALKRFNPSDTVLLREVREAADRLSEEDPELEAHPLLRRSVTREAKKVHLE